MVSRNEMPLRPVKASLLMVLIGAASALSGGAALARKPWISPGHTVQSALVAFVSWGTKNPPGRPAQFKHLGTGFLATRSGWIVTLDHVLAARPKDATCSVIAFVRPDMVTELPIVEGPLFPPHSQKGTSACLVRVGRVPPQLNPVDFGYRVQPTQRGAVRLWTQVLPCAEIGLYATLLGESEPGFPALTGLHRYARKGIVSAVSRFPDGSEVYFLDVVGFSGYSGCPVFLWETGGVIGAVISLEARRQRFNDADAKNNVQTYIMHGIRGVQVAGCVELLLRRGETLSFVDPVTGDRYRFSLREGRVRAGEKR